MSQITKRALENSLKNLLLQKPLHKITIADIANDCGISRMTFYYHFKDIYDLIEWICNEETARAIQGNKTYETWQQGFLQTFQMVLDNKPFILNVYRSIRKEIIEDYFYTITFDLLMGVVEEKAVGMSVTESDKKFIANFYSFAFVGLLLDWIKRDMRDDPKVIIDQVSTLIHGDISRALTQYQHNGFNQITKND
ncbi:TetR/AcrR family transcriptional regulator [Lacrimispora sp.]|uniref:TetR/AcrR family transcriptional regulator n=1 Tax=Lacrimispora sp. TaxID=2719234 RepID=UPI00399418A2